MSVPVQLTCWVTGAGSGIGRELALRLAAAGHTVYISARTTAALDELALSQPGRLLPLPCDVADDEQMNGLFGRLPAAPTTLDLVILCAGICEYVDMPALNPALFRRVMAVNFLGTVNSCRVALPLLQAAARQFPERRPQLVGLASMSTYVGFPRAEAYGAAKAAMAYFLDSLRCDVGQQLDVTVVYPGFVATPLTARNDFAMPFLQSAATAAEHILARLGRGRRRISFPWQLHGLLRLAALLPGLWYGPVMRFLSRRQRGVRT